MFCYFQQPETLVEKVEPQNVTHQPCEWENGYFAKTSK